MQVESLRISSDTLLKVSCSIQYKLRSNCRTEWRQNITEVESLEIKIQYYSKHRVRPLKVVLQATGKFDDTVLGDLLMSNPRSQDALVDIQPSF